MKRFLAVLLCLAMVLGMVPAVMASAVQTDERTAEEILKERRDTVYNTMMSMANFLWRATEDFTYYFATSKVTIVKGRLYRGMPYTHARGTLASFMEYTGEPNEKGEHDLIGATPEMFDGGSQHARLGNDCSGAASTAYATVSATTKNVGSSTVTISKGFIPVGNYKPDPNSNSQGKQICIDNGEQVMYAAYAQTQYADLVACSGHTMMTQKVNVVYKNDGTIDGDLSTMTVVHQNPDPIRNNKYFQSGPYSEANYGEKVYRTFLIDDAKTFKWLFDAGYMPYTCIELIDPAPIPEVQVTDTESEHSFANIMTGTIKANRLIDCVTMTITDEKGNEVQKGTARCYRTDGKGTNWDMTYDLNQLRLESPQKMKGHLNVNQLGVGNYHCRLDVRLMTGQTVEKVRDFDFTVTEDDLGEGWVDNSNLVFTDGNKAVCPVCGGDPVEWTVLPEISTAQNLAPAHYYLDKDLNNTARYGLENGSAVCVHLNGHNITSSSQVFWMGASRTLLNVMGNGNVVGGHTAEDSTYGATINFSAATAKAALYGGNYGHSFGTTRPTVVLEASEPKLTIYSGATFCRMDDAQGANIEIRSGVVELRGGRILDGTYNSGSGGNVRVYSSSKFTGWPSTFTMYDGIIAGGRAKNAGNVAVFREDSTHGSKDRTFTMEGGLLHFGFAGYAAGSAGVGGNIYASGTVAKVNINGGTVTYGKAYKGGGNIYAKSGAQVTIGGVLENGNGDYSSTGQSGGNIYLYGEGSKLTITGTVRDPLTASATGGNIFCSNADVVVDGGTVSGGTATSRGGNIYLTNKRTSLTVKNGGKIIGGTAALGGNVATNIADTVIHMESGEISGGTATENGPDLLLYAAATVNLSGGSVGKVYGNSGKFHLSGDAKVEKLSFTSGTLKIDNGWTGRADVNWGGQYVTDDVLTKASCGSTVDGTFAAGGSFAGTLIYNGKSRAVGKDGVIALDDTVQPGDLDGILGVNEDDAVYLLQHILMSELFPVSQNVDFDGSGSVDEDDAIYLLQHILMPDMFPL